MGATKKLVRCKKCEPCTRDPCGTCGNCLDSPRFGGPNVWKQACKFKKCANPNGSGGAAEEEDKKPKKPVGRPAVGFKTHEYFQNIQKIASSSIKSPPGPSSPLKRFENTSVNVSMITEPEDENGSKYIMSPHPPPSTPSKRLAVLPGKVPTYTTQVSAQQKTPSKGNLPPPSMQSNKENVMENTNCDSVANRVKKRKRNQVVQAKSYLELSSTEMGGDEVYDAVMEPTPPVATSTPLPGVSDGIPVESVKKRRLLEPLRCFITTIEGGPGVPPVENTNSTPKQEPLLVQLDNTPPDVIKIDGSPPNDKVDGELGSPEAPELSNYRLGTGVTITRVFEPCTTRSASLDVSLVTNNSMFSASVSVSNVVAFNLTPDVLGLFTLILTVPSASGRDPTLLSRVEEDVSWFCSPVSTVYVMDNVIEIKLTDRDMAKAILHGLKQKYPSLEGDTQGLYDDIICDRKTGLYTLCFTDTRRKMFKGTMNMFQKYSKVPPLLSKGNGDDIFVGYCEKSAAIEALRDNITSKEYPKLHVAIASRKL